MKRHLNPAHVVVALLGFFLSFSAATQYAAHALRYQRALGAPLFKVGGVPIYFPFEVVDWDLRFDRYAPAIFERAMWVAYGGCVFTIAALVVIAMLRGAPPAAGNTHGSARFATEEELEKGGILVDQGVVFGQTADAKLEEYVDAKGERRLRQKRPGRRLLRHNGPEHLFVFAPTRSGKGVGIVIPSLLSWVGSVLVYDIKKELWHATAGWRRKFSHVIRFEPTAEYSARYNPLLEVRRGVQEVKDTQNIVEILIDPEGTREKKDHWKLAGGNLLTAACLHVLYAEKDKSLPGVGAFLADPARDAVATLNLMLNYPHTPQGPHPLVASVAREMLNKSENELSGVFSTAVSFLGIYRDPLVARNMSKSDFRISDLMHGERPVSLYVVVPPSDDERLTPVVRLVLNQIGKRLTESMEPPVYKKAVNWLGNLLRRLFGRAEKEVHGAPAVKPLQRLLMVIDELPSLGRLRFLEKGLAFFAGYGIKCLLIAQSLGQLEEAYGEKTSILDNAHVRICYGANNEKTAQRIAEMLGKTTIVTRQVSYSGQRLAGWLGNKSESQQEHARDLLTAGEIMSLPADQALVLVGGLPPYRAKKLLYFADPRFEGRPNLPVPEDRKEQAREFPRHSQPNDWANLKPVQKPAAGAAAPVPAPTAAGTPAATAPAAQAAVPPPVVVVPGRPTPATPLGPPNAAQASANLLVQAALAPPAFASRASAGAKPEKKGPVSLDLFPELQPAPAAAGAAAAARPVAAAAAPADNLDMDFAELFDAVGVQPGPASTSSSTEAPAVPPDAVAATTGTDSGSRRRGGDLPL